MPQQPNRWFVGHIHCSDKLVRAGPDHTTRFPNYVTLPEYTQTADQYEQWRYLLNPCRIRFGLMLIELCIQLAVNSDFKLKLILTIRLVCHDLLLDCVFIVNSAVIFKEEIIALKKDSLNYFQLRTSIKFLNIIHWIVWWYATVFNIYRY